MLLEEDWEQVKFLRDSAVKKAQEPTPRITILQATYAIDTTDNGELKLNMQVLALLERNGMVSRRTALWDCYRLYHYIGYRRACYSR